MHFYIKLLQKNDENVGIFSSSTVTKKMNFQSVRTQLTDATWNWPKYRSICTFNLGRTNTQSNCSGSYSEEEGQKKEQREITNGALSFNETTVKSTKIAVTQTAGTTSIWHLKNSNGMSEIMKLERTKNTIKLGCNNNKIQVKPQCKNCSF